MYKQLSSQKMIKEATTLTTPTMSATRSNDTALGAQVISFKVKMLSQMKVDGDEFSRLLSELDTRRDELKAIEDNWNALETRIKENMQKMNTTIKLNLRGKFFETIKDNLVREEGSYFHTLLSSGLRKPANDGILNIYCPLVSFHR
jgi:hypothetical protein